MKRIIFIISVFAVIFGLLTAVALAENEPTVTKEFGSVGDGVVAELLSDGTLLIRLSDDFSAENTGEMNDYKNTSSGRPPYYSDRASVTSIRVAKGVTYIGDHSLRGMTQNLTSVILEDGVAKIGDAAFNGDKIENLYLPKSLTSVMGSGGAPFANSDITNLYYSGSVADWCVIAFSAKTSSPTNYTTNFYIDGELITDLKVPHGVAEIKKYAFRGYDSLVSVSLPTSVGAIGDQSFDQCTGLKKITVPASVTLGSSAIYKNKLEEAVLIADEGETIISGELLEMLVSVSTSLKCEDLSIILDDETMSAISAPYVLDGESPILSCFFDSEATDSTRVTKIAFDILDKNGNSLFSFTKGKTVVYKLEEAPLAKAVGLSYSGECASRHSDETSGEVMLSALSAGEISVSVDTREKPRFTGAYVSLGDSISLIYRVSIPQGYSAPALSVQFEECEYTVSPDEVSFGVYDYRFTEIMPYQMNDSVSAALTLKYEDGTDVTVSNRGMSIRKYYEAALVYYPDNTKLMTLLSDMLSYGARAQLYKGYKTDSLATDELDTLTPSEYEAAPSVFSVSAHSEDTRFNGAALYCTDSMGVYITFFSTLDNAKVRISLNGRTVEHEVGELTANQDGMYRILYTDIMAYEFSDTITAELINGDTGDAVSSLTYSVNSYVTENMDNSDTVLVDMLRAIQCYGNSAKEYRGRDENEKI